MERILKGLNELLEPKGIKIYGKRIAPEGKTYNLFSSIIDELINHWHKFSKEEKEEIARTIMKTNRNYLGDVKWVLYQYICDMDGDNINIRCGNFALNKLVPSNTVSFNNYGLPYYNININGERIVVCHIPKMSKKQLIISTHNYDFNNGLIDDTTIYPGDIVLYFA